MLVSSSSRPPTKAVGCTTAVSDSVDGSADWWCDGVEMGSGGDKEMVVLREWYFVAVVRK